MYPTLLQYGSFRINSWGTMVIFAAIVALLLIFIRIRKANIPASKAKAILNYLLSVAIAGFIGARIFFIIENFDFFLRNPREILALRQAGLSSYGGLIFGLLMGYWLVRKGKFDFGFVLDIFAPVIAVGFFIVRIGCFLAGCCFGKPTQMPWGVGFPPGSPADIVYGGLIKVHPTQLYYSFSGLISFIILLITERRFKKRSSGLIFFFFLILFGLWRFIIEFFRWHDPSSYLVSWVTWGHVFSVAVFFLGVVLLCCNIRRHRRTLNY